MKETHYKLKHRVTALFAAAVMLCSMLPGAAFAEEPTPQPTEETVQMEQQTEPSETDNGQTDESSPDPGEDVTEATPETAEEQPAEEEIPAAVVGAELYTDLPDAPIGSYIGSEGLPVATGETKIGISEWPESQLEEGGSYLTAVALDNDGLTILCATPSTTHNVMRASLSSWKPKRPQAILAIGQTSIIPAWPTLRWASAVTISKSPRIRTIL